MALTWNFTPYPGYTAVRGTVNGATQTVSATKSGSVSVHVGYKTVAAWSLTDNYGNIYNGSLTTGAPAISDSVGILVG